MFRNLCFHERVRTSIRIYWRICMSACMRTCVYVRTCVCTCVCEYMRIYIYIYIYICMYVYVHTHTHTHTHIARYIVYYNVLKIHTLINGRTPNIYDWSHDFDRFSLERLTVHSSLTFLLSMSPMQSVANKYFVILDDICRIHMSIVPSKLDVITFNFQKIKRLKYT